MQETTGKFLARGAMLAAVAIAIGLPLSLSSPAFAASPHVRPAHADGHKPVATAKVRHTATRVRRGPVLQCVAFARDASGIHLSGNAHAWWHNAAGQFQRGQQPERGAVLNFRASGGMRMGHVSVVNRVVSDREILIDDANWAAPGQRKGMVRRAASVIDVSANNDWTEVRVANGIGSWGRVYPTYGFIYPRADRGDERIEIAAARDAQPAYSRLPQAVQTAPRLPDSVATGVTSPEAATAVASGKGWTWNVPQAPAPQATASPSRAPQAASARNRAVGPQAAVAPQPAAVQGWVWANGVAAAR